MCTVSWTRTADQYDVFFSRDEKRTRVTGEPPFVWDDLPTKILAPRDPQGGGTWILVNELGLTVCVMNAYDSEPGDGDAGTWSSRGQLLLALAVADTPAALQDRLADALRGARYRPGFVLAWSRTGAARCWSWEKSEMEELGEPPRPMLTTSSFEPRKVMDARRAAFEQVCSPGKRPPAPDALRRFHLAEKQAPDAYSVRMSRADAHTVSLTHVRVSHDMALMAYAPRDKDAGFAPLSKMTLQLKNRSQ